jgi:hypothetical protein
MGDEDIQTFSKKEQNRSLHSPSLALESHLFPIPWWLLGGARVVDTSDVASDSRCGSSTGAFDQGVHIAARRR